MPRLLLLLPTATYRAAAYLAAASKLGVEVVTGSEEPQALEAVMGSHFALLDLDHPARAVGQITELATRRSLDAIVATDDETNVIAALAADRLGLRHSPPDAVAATHDKVTMRARAAAAGIDQPRYAVVAGGDPPSGPARGATASGAAAAAIGYPVVVKPSSLSGSRGVIRVDEPSAIEAVAARVAGIARAAGRFDEPLLVEQYIDGTEVALEGIVRDGKLEVLAVFDKPEPLVGPYFEETIYVTPSRHTPAACSRCVDLAGRAVAALGLSEGPVHVELRLEHVAGGGERPVLIELAARTIGGRCAGVLRFEGDKSLEELVLTAALEPTREPLPERLDESTGVLMVPIPASGRLVEVRGVEQVRGIAEITGVELTIPAGRHVQALPEGDRYLGFVFARAKDPSAVEAALVTARQLLEVVIEPSRP